MHRTRPLAAVALTTLLALAASACGVLADTSAATVSGRTVSIDSVEQLAGDEAFVGSEQPGITEGTVPGDLFRSVLQFELQRVAWLAEADRWGVEITDEMRQAASSEVDAQIASTGLEYESATREKIEEYVAAQTALETRFSQLDPANERDLRLLYDGAPSLWDRICVAVVQVGTDQAGQVRGALDAGTTIEEMPTEVEGATLAADPSQQCVPRSQLPDELTDAFDSAAIGRDEGPVTIGDPAAGGATYFYRVDDRRRVGFDEARDELSQILQSLTQQGAQAWIGLVVSEADIDPRFGSGVSSGPNGQAVIDAPPVPLTVSRDLGGMLGTSPGAVDGEDGHDH